MPEFSYRALLRDRVRAHGVGRTAWEFLAGVANIVLDLLPARRRRRYGDIDFDCDRRVNTTWANLGLGTRIRELFAGRGYQPSDPEIFRQMMAHLPADPRSLTFLDLGSGKGRALLLAADYPFRRVVGVELLPELHRVARQNVTGYHAVTQQCAAFELHCADARQFALPAEPLFVYLFDPFPENVLREVVDNIEESLRRRPRTLFLGYQNPISEYLLDASPQLARLEGTIQWALYAGRARL